MGSTVLSIFTFSAEGSAGSECEYALVSSVKQLERHHALVACMFHCLGCTEFIVNNIQVSRSSCQPL